jgi:thiamine-phosphate diphosphorylase
MLALGRLTAVPLDRHEKLIDSRLTLVCSEVDAQRLEAALKGGVDIVQLRGDGVGEVQFSALATEARRLCDAHGALLILHEHAGLAKTVGADGVHLSSVSADAVAQARAQLDPDQLLGIDCRTPQDVRATDELGVDYFHLGPIHATPSEPDRAPTGHQSITFASRNSKLPFFATGGVEPHNTGALAAAGAQRIAVTRAITQAKEPALSAEVLRSEIQAPVDFLERYRARTEAQNAAARAKLEPLAAGERPWPLKLAAGLAALAGIVNLIAYLAGTKVNGSELSGGEIAAFTVIALVLAVGLWQRNGPAVLATMVVLAIIVVLFSLFLIEASNVLGVIVPLLFIGVGGWLFWKLIRILGRIQTPGQYTD